MKTAMYALVALSLGLSAALPASAAFGPKDIQTFEGPGFGPTDVRSFEGPGFGPADVRSFEGPGFGPADVRSFEGPGNGEDTLADRK